MRRTSRRFALGDYLQHRSGTVLAGVLLALLTLGPMPAASADSVTTTSGETFTGTIVEKTDEHVILKTISGTITISANQVKAIEASDPAPDPDPDPAKPAPAKPVPKVVPADIPPEKADASFKEARSALVAGDWVKAGGLLEGLLRLDVKDFDAKKRIGATGALITCYLQIKDPFGAARAIGLRSSTAKDPNDRKRLLAASEMLRTLRTVTVNGKTLGRFEEVAEAAMPWKADQCLQKAVTIAQNASNLNSQTHLNKAADNALEQLAEANVYVPGYSASHKAEVLGQLVTNILNAAREAVKHCEKVRPALTRTRLSSIVSKAAAAQWNQVARVYLGNRQAAESALWLIKAFALRHETPDLYTANTADIESLLAELKEYQYYPRGTAHSYSPYSPYYGSSTRLKIQLRVF